MASRRVASSIPTRITLGLLLVLLVFGSVAAASWYQHYRSAKIMKLLQEGYLPLALTLGEAKAAEGIHRQLLDRMMETHEATSARSWIVAAQQLRPATIKQALTQLQNARQMERAVGINSGLLQVHQFLVSLAELQLSSNASYSQLFHAIDQGNTAQRDQLIKELQELEARVQILYRESWRSIQSIITDTSTQVADAESRASLLLALLALVAGIVGIAVVVWSQRLLRPLPQLYARVQAVARGELTPAQLVDRNDELSQLGVEFDRMVKALAVRDVRLREASEAEQRLKQMQTQIVRGLHAAVIVIDENDIITMANAAAQSVLGVSERDVGSVWSNTAAAAAIPDLAEPIARAKQQALEEPIFLEAISVRGFQERLADVSLSTIQQRGEALSVLIVAEDVTNAHATKARLIQSERLAAIGRMAAHVTHEVRNPLSSVSLNLDLLREGVDMTNSENRNLIEAIQRELDRLTSITEEYLRLARLPDPVLQAEDVSLLVTQVANFVAREMSMSNVNIKMNLDRGLPEVAIDNAQIRQAILNLLHNAREAMPGGGSIQIDARRYEDGVLIQIHDEGQGLAESDQERVFDLFYTTKERGTGLGLTLTQQIVAAHGGKIRCRSRLPHGATFEVWLPRYDDEMISQQMN